MYTPLYLTFILQKHVRHVFVIIDKTDTNFLVSQNILADLKGLSGKYNLHCTVR